MLRTTLVPALLTAAAAILLLMYGQRRPEQRVLNVVVIGLGADAAATGPLTKLYGLQAGVIVDERVYKSSGDGVNWLLLDPYGDEIARGTLVDAAHQEYWRIVRDDAKPGSLLMMYRAGAAAVTRAEDAVDWVPEGSAAWVLLSQKETTGWKALQEDRPAEGKAEIAARPLVLRKTKTGSS